MPATKLPVLRPRPRNSDLEHVYAELTRSIMMAEFAPGQKLKLDDLATAFGTSHMPVREALNRLVMARALQSETRRTPFIPEASVGRLRNLLTLRTDLEGKAVAMTVERGENGLADQLAQINARMDIEAERGALGTRAYLQLNHKFHFSLYERCGNPELVNLIELLWMRYGPLLSLLKATPMSFSGHRHHADIIAAVRSGDSATAVQSLVADLQEAGDAIATALSTKIQKAHSSSSSAP
ncbi:GntR family transcriptional regulator [Mesorhizobium sp.]|uniref:GntR family transcriptional regulator n=1 Tax=Mesorhizobium sp. TaxID=1871066 RepID=UPI000FE2E6ED|nr:GntR family transcriptional regulator [Mesorhizobium sp.]RWA97212.1 MAG: GntR family transcriptional regulator [Mesorhizobium sp.]RWK58382.1 MAG: GntR family transcriptional regulator [Mesorhizobium sp.]RWM42241.1 MAG: GntR family transcriptional regulator [Mesorhizobium sp.]RWM45221.1 MAG: GntR family transcriptional regulator [Mesorhizobium sp.]RWM51582.1 MAG: GntR family transcriptional regulator [Mesorhizobium sp.]